MVYHGNRVARGSYRFSKCCSNFRVVLSFVAQIPLFFLSLSLCRGRLGRKARGGRQGTTVELREGVSCWNGPCNRAVYW